jgi:uncharacterized protein with HEPN domain
LSMRPDEKDASYLWDMLNHTRIVMEITEGVSYKSYQGDKTLQLAVERAVEIIGEASRRISDAFKDAHPELPWRGMIAQRNVLAHEYGEIKIERMWVVIKQRIPELITLLEKLDVPPPPTDPEPVS